LTGDTKEGGEEKEAEEEEASALVRRAPCLMPSRRVITIHILFFTEYHCYDLLHVSSALRPSLPPSLPCSLPQALAVIGDFLEMGHFVSVHGVVYSRITCEFRRFFIPPLLHPSLPSSVPSSFCHSTYRYITHIITPCRPPFRSSVPYLSFCTCQAIMDVQGREVVGLDVENLRMRCPARRTHQEGAQEA